MILEREQAMSTLHLSLQFYRETARALGLMCMRKSFFRAGVGGAWLVLMVSRLVVVMSDSGLY